MAEDIRVYNFEFELLDIEPRYLSSNWQVYYNDIGTFEAHFDLSSRLLHLLTQQDYLVMVQGARSAIVTSFQLGEDLAVYGRTCNWILTKRAAAPFEASQQTAEEIVRAQVAAAFSDVENFVLGELMGFTEKIDFGIESYTALSDVVKDCMALSGGGHEVIFDTKNEQWIFQALKGEKSSLVLSEANRNAADIQYSADILSYCSGGWYQYQAEAEEGQEQPDPVWTYLNGDETKTGIYRWDSVLSGKTEAEARTELFQQTKTKEATLKTQGLTCGVDYRLGDIVRMQIQKGPLQMTKEKRITGVHLWYETNDMGEEPILEEENNGI